MPTLYNAAGGIVGPATRQIEGIKQEKARTTLAELAASEAPGTAARQRTLQDIAISKGQEELTNLPIQRRREAEQADMNKKLGILTFQMQTYPYAKTRKAYGEWRDDMIRNGVNPEYVPALDPNMTEEQYRKEWQDTMDRYSGFQNQLRLENKRQQGQTNLEEKRAKAQKEIAEIAAGSRRDYDTLSATDKARILLNAPSAYDGQWKMPDPKNPDGAWIEAPGAPGYSEKWAKEYYEKVRGVAESGATNWRAFR